MTQPNQKKRGTHSLTPHLLLPIPPGGNKYFSSREDENGPGFLFCFKIEGAFPSDANDVGCSQLCMKLEEKAYMCVFPVKVAVRTWREVTNGTQPRVACCGLI